MSGATAIVLTGGLGTRMRPLSSDKEKSMVAFMGRPLLLHLVRLLGSHGLSNIVFTSPGKRGDIKDYFSDGREYGVSIEYYGGEEKWLGTAGTIRNLVDEMRDSVASDNLLVIYGDSLLKADLGKMLQFHTRTESWCTILYHRPRFESFVYEYHDGAFDDRGERTNYGVMDIGPDGRIVKVKEKAVIAQLEREFTNPVANAAVYAIRKDLLEYVPRDHPSDFPRHVFPSLIERGIPCLGFDIEDGYRVDIGTIPTYYAMQLAILHEKVDFDIDFPRLRERVWVGNASTVDSPGKIEEPVLICDSSKVGPGTTVECSIIGNNVHVGRSCSIKGSIILDHVDIGDGVQISDSIVGEHCSSDDGVHLPPNTVLGDYCRLGGSELAMTDLDLCGLIRG
jgi:mannose-1-phosphate guanylyltransferase/phosphomannomutase